MILEFGLPDFGVTRLTPLLPDAEELRRLSSLRRVESQAPKARGILLGLQEPPSPSLLDSLQSLRRRHRWLPIVVAGPEQEIGMESGDRQQLMEAGVDRVISWSMLGRRDIETRAVWRRMPLLRLAYVVHRAHHLPDPVRGLMVRAIAEMRPVPSVAALAALGGLHRASLSRLWSRASRDVPTVGVFVDWLQLLHAVVRKDSGRTWRGVAHELEIRHSSIARMGTRVLGHTLSEYDLTARREIFERFLREMMGMTPSEIKRHAPMAPPLSRPALESPARLGFESLQLEPPAPLPTRAPRGHADFLGIGIWMM